MKNLPSPSRAGARGDLTAALKTYRYKGQVRGYSASPEEIDGLIALYDVYDGSPATPPAELKGATLPNDLRVALQAAFDLTQAGRRLSHIRSDIFKDIEQCPICGIDAPGELDHYLPQSQFKPLSIYTRNLVPLCHDCNQKKRSYYSEVPEEQFIHAYLEILPNVQFLKATVKIENDSLLVDFDIDETIEFDELLRARLSYQLKELDLNRRYRREVNVYLSSFAVSLKIAHDTGGATEVRRFLTLQATYEDDRFHRNHWRPVLLRALAESLEFCDLGFANVLPLPASLLGSFVHLRAAEANVS